MGRLILNADDFGLTSGVNRAIMELHRLGVLTSTTLMAQAPASSEAIEMSRATPSLGVGCHVVLVDGDPVLSPRREIPHLADALTGRFNPTLGGFLGDWFRHWLSGNQLAFFKEIEAEAAAQIALLQSRGVQLTHIDTHKHTHMFPAVLRPILRAARAAGIRAVRNPFEPAWSVLATSGADPIRRVEVSLLRRLEPAFRRIVSEEGFTTTDGTIGILATGSLDQIVLDSLLAEMPEGTWELVTHPGYRDDDLARAHTRLLGSREMERRSLQKLRDFAGIERISFAGLTGLSAS
jgi:predicted glycoside hydrolase/deacetylase ChbG (UPF0249 family)